MPRHTSLDKSYSHSNLTLSHYLSLYLSLSINLSLAISIYQSLYLSISIPISISISPHLSISIVHLKQTFTFLVPWFFHTKSIYFYLLAVSPLSLTLLSDVLIFSLSHHSLSLFYTHYLYRSFFLIPFFFILSFSLTHSVFLIIPFISNTLYLSLFLGLSFFILSFFLSYTHFLTLSILSPARSHSSSHVLSLSLIQTNNFSFLSLLSLFQPTISGSKISFRKTQKYAKKDFFRSGQNSSLRF